MHDEWAPHASSAVTTPLKRPVGRDRGSSARKKLRTSFMMDQEQLNCQSSVALLDAFNLPATATLASGTASTLFEQLENEINVANTLNMGPDASCCARVTVRNAADVLVEAQSSRFFEEMNYLLHDFPENKKLVYFSFFFAFPSFYLAWL